MKISCVGPVGARTGSVPMTKPSTYAPETPRYDDAGRRLHRRNPRPPPPGSTGRRPTRGGAAAGRLSHSADLEQRDEPLCPRHGVERDSRTDADANRQCERQQIDIEHTSGRLEPDVYSIIGSEPLPTVSVMYRNGWKYARAF